MSANISLFTEKQIFFSQVSVPLSVCSWQTLSKGKSLYKFIFDWGLLIIDQIEQICVSDGEMVVHLQQVFH